MASCAFHVVYAWVICLNWPHILDSHRLDFEAAPQNGFGEGPPTARADVRTVEPPKRAFHGQLTDSHTLFFVLPVQFLKRSDCHVDIFRVNPRSTEELLEHQQVASLGLYLYIDGLLNFNGC